MKRYSLASLYGKNNKIDKFIDNFELSHKIKKEKISLKKLNLILLTDILIKKEHNRELTKKFVKYLLDMWDNIKPSKNKQEQQKCELRFTSSKKLKVFKELNKYDGYSVEFIGHTLELIMIQEKTGSIKAYMFKDVLEAIYNDEDIFSIVSKAGYGGR